MDIEKRMANLEKKIDGLHELLRSYREELLRDYYTKTEVDEKIENLPALRIDVELVKQAIVNSQANFERLRETLEGGLPRKAQVISTAFIIILILASIVSQLLGIKVP